VPQPRPPPPPLLLHAPDPIVCVPPVQAPVRRLSSDSAAERNSSINAAPAPSCVSGNTQHPQSKSAGRCFAGCWVPSCMCAEVCCLAHLPGTAEHGGKHFPRRGTATAGRTAHRGPSHSLQQCLKLSSQSARPNFAPVQVGVGASCAARQDVRGAHMQLSLGHCLEGRFAAAHSCCRRWDARLCSFAFEAGPAVALAPSPPAANRLQLRWCCRANWRANWKGAWLCAPAYISPPLPRRAANKSADWGPVVAHHSTCGG
jgi:hypothetical protein